MKTEKKNASEAETTKGKISIVVGIVVLLVIFVSEARANRFCASALRFGNMHQTDTTTKTIDVRELKKYTGEYILQSETRILEFKAFVNEGKLNVHPAGQNVGIMKYVGDHTFIHTKNADIKLVFVMEDKKVKSVTLHQRGKQVSGKPKD